MPTEDIMEQNFFPRYLTTDLTTIVFNFCKKKSCIFYSKMEKKKSRRQITSYTREYSFILKEIWT